MTTSNDCRPRRDRGRRDVQPPGRPRPYAGPGLVAVHPGLRRRLDTRPRCRHRRPVRRLCRTGLYRILLRGMPTMRSRHRDHRLSAAVGGRTLCPATLHDRDRYLEANAHRRGGLRLMRHTESPHHLAWADEFASGALAFDYWAGPRSPRNSSASSLPASGTGSSTTPASSEPSRGDSPIPCPGYAVIAVVAPRAGFRSRTGAVTVHSGKGWASKKSQISCVASIEVVLLPTKTSGKGTTVSPGQTCPPPWTEYSSTSVPAGQG